MQAGIEVDVLLGGDGGVCAHVRNAEQLRGGVERLRGDAVVLAGGRAHVNVATQRVEGDIATEFNAQLALDGIARFEHASVNTPPWSASVMAVSTASETASTQMPFRAWMFAPSPTAARTALTAMFSAK